MKRKKVIAVTALIIIGIGLGYRIFNGESMERRILTGKFYKSSTEKASGILKFSINPKDYLKCKGEELGKRRLLMKKYDTKVYLEPIKSQGDDLWIEWSFDNNWWKRSGACFTYEAIINKNGQRLYSNADTMLEAVDQYGNRVNEDWGGGGSTYVYGFRIERQEFKHCKTINIKLKGFNILKYKLRL